MKKKINVSQKEDFINPTTIPINDTRIYKMT